VNLYGGLPRRDLLRLLEESKQTPSEIRNSNFVIVGANGFLGKWLSCYLALLEENGILLGSLTLVTRNPNHLASQFSNVKSKKLKIVSSSEIGKEKLENLVSDRTAVIFAATSTADSGMKRESNYSEGIQLSSSVVSSLPTKENHFVHLSTGGIYESSSRSLQAIPKDYKVRTDSDDKYLHDKISLENWLKTKESEGKLSVRNPRLFSFYGPGLQLDRHFAIGAFMKDALSGSTIEVTGNPANLRSYLYPPDAVVQIMSQCLSTPAQFSQIGSKTVYSISEVARIIGKIFDVKVSINSNQIANADNYVPNDLQFTSEKSIDEGIRTWAEWLQQSQSNNSSTT
jgi:dTDP-glucose 4,6-dehydratase